MSIVKIFFDVLSDYEDLKYIFEYGFYWDDSLSKMKCHKGSQTIRRLTNVLSDPVYPVCANKPWDKDKPESAKKLGRRVIWNNHYRLEKQQWFHLLYRCLGRCDDTAEKFVEQCNKDTFYYDCRAEENLCTYRRICRNKYDIELFLELSGKRGKRLEKDDEVLKEIQNEYEDILERDADRLYLKTNRWTEECLRQEGVFEDEEGYSRFIELLQFFAMFTPLSILGGNFLYRLGYPAVSSLFLVRNLPPGYGLEQEYLYRCLYAMAGKRLVEYDEKEYLPLGLEYRDKGFSGLKENLYLWAKEVSEEGTVRMLPLFDGHYIQPRKKAVFSQEEWMKEIRLSEEKYTVFEVDFFYLDSETEYLKKRRKEGWKDEILLEQKKYELGIHSMISPYYPDYTEWKTDRETYRVAKEDIPGFLFFIRSFGDFASLKNREEGIQDIKPESSKAKTRKKRQIKGKIREYQSLLSVYNSEKLLNMNTRLLPPRFAELEWLYFVLQSYGNICRLFLKEEEIQALQKEIIDEIGHEKWCFYKNKAIIQRVRDIEKSKIGKYQRIIKAVKEHQVLRYGIKDKPVCILPYALEYDMTRCLVKKEKTYAPFDVMCYDLLEKRNVNILYQTIETLEAEAQDAYSFSDLDKLYHIFAYALRCAKEGKKNIESKAEELLRHVWEEDLRGDSNYNRCVRKKQGKERGFQGAYQCLEQLCRDCPDEEALEFVKRVFGYWNEETEDTSYPWDYRNLLIRCFTAGCKKMWEEKEKKELKTCLDQFTNQDIWELICGKEIDGIVNEIAFYNESFKNSKISFSLKPGMEDKIDIIYRLFGSFLCTGKREDRKLHFEVTYETFYYRKVHMALMVIHEWIENLEPLDVAEIIQKRLENMRRTEDGKLGSFGGSGEN